MIRVLIKRVGNATLHTAPSSGDNPELLVDDWRAIHLLSSIGGKLVRDWPDGIHDVSDLLYRDTMETVGQDL